VPNTKKLFIDRDAFLKITCHSVDCSATTIICRLKINMVRSEVFYNAIYGFILFILFYVNQVEI